MSEPPGSVGRVLESFHPAVRRWFEGRFPDGPTEPQAGGGREIAAGRPPPVAAPTRPGKKRGAFLVCIHPLYPPPDPSSPPHHFFGHRVQTHAETPAAANRPP